MNGNVVDEHGQIDEIKPDSGLIGYFDILGYERLLEVNTAAYVANKIMRILHSLGPELEQWQKHDFEKMGLPEQSREPVINLIRNIKVLVISDTILVTLATDTAKGHYDFTYWHLFAGHCSRLWEKTFSEGLPLRGAITHGEFVVQKSCWAGKPIVDAYRRAECLDFSGCVIADDTRVWIEAALGAMKLQNEFVFAPNSVPLNDGTFMQGTVFNVNWHRLATEVEIADIRQAVHEPFWAHGKDVSGNVPRKIDNTERYLRFLHALRRGKPTPFKKRA